LADLPVGHSVAAVLAEGLTRTQIVQYAGASGDFNALHTDEVYARQVRRLPGVIAHGMLTMGMTGRLVADALGVENLRRSAAGSSHRCGPATR